MDVNADSTASRGPADVQHAIRSLTRYNPGSRKKLHLRGSRAYFNTTVYQHEELRSEHSTGQEAKVLCNQLRKNISHAVKEKVIRVLNNWGKMKPSRSWMSYTLPLDLNLRMHFAEPDGTRLQTLFACEDQPFIMLTLYDSPDDKQRTADVRRDEVKRFTVIMSQLLTSSLFNFCHCDFILVPCVLEYNSIREKTLEEEVKTQLLSLRKFYRGPMRLTSRTFAQLCAGVEAVSGVSHVPALFENPDNSVPRWLLLLTDDWRDVVSLLIEKLVKKDFERPLFFTEESEFKLQVAVLEAAKRFSYSRRVTIVTSATDLHSRVRGLVEVVAQEDERKIHLTASDGSTTLPEAEYLIYVDYPVGTGGNPSLRLEKAEAFRFLLLGKTGTGRSTTGNTILREKRFKCTESFSFTSGTSSCQIGSNTLDGKEITVMDSPGLLDTRRENGVLYSLVKKAAAVQPGFDAILYTLKIGSGFTEGDFAVYERLKEVFGKEATRYMIIVFTHGDELNGTNIEDELETASQPLKEILSECSNRYVVFNNMVEDKKQVETLLVKVMEMRVHNEKQPFRCQPYNTSSVEQIAGEISRRLAHVRQTEMGRTGRRA